jgi:hypothetical protein
MDAMAFSTFLTQPMQRHCISTWSVNRLASSCELKKQIHLSLLSPDKKTQQTKKNMKPPYRPHGRVSFSCVMLFAAAGDHSLEAGTVGKDRFK